MMPTDPGAMQGMLDLAWRGGLLLALLYFIWAGSTKRIVWGYQLEECQKQKTEEMAFLRADFEKRLARVNEECDSWRDLALEGRDIVRSAVNVAEKRS
jgi:hypothetical protein